MEVIRSERDIDKLPQLQGQMVLQRTRLQALFIRVCSSILIWTCLVQLVTVGVLSLSAHQTALKELSTLVHGPKPICVQEWVPKTSNNLNPTLANCNKSSKGMLNFFQCSSFGFWNPKLHKYYCKN
ncbi:O-fucosyltransferase family protein [Forsythia ovata]|uniref:O-fucosyltransferase family protein n=1 Tax=Forsythia ovata TaxID=205694 RepID=A0ABD1U6P0_9LAMI